MVPKDAEIFLAGACPIIGSYGAQDWTLCGAADRLERALSQRRGARHQAISRCRARVPQQPPRLDVQSDEHREHWLPRALAHDARRRIVTFFNAHLKSEKPAGTGAHDGSRESDE
jgi:carboxymethylenebutenolidase